jgi:biotin-(acetyl-CoA carboxylase) ligase
MDREGLDLPPGYRAIALRESGDAFAHARAVAEREGAGTFVHVRRYDLVEFAVVLEPEEPLRSARRAFFAGMLAVAEAIAAHCPPEREVAFAWPDTIIFDHGVVGGGRLAWPENAAEDEIPDWLVFGCMLRAVDLSHVEAGLHAGATSLVAEGFDLVDVDSIAESFARHLMTAFDLWGEQGFRAVGEEYLKRLPKKKAGEQRIIDANGDLLTTLPLASEAERLPLVPALMEAAWLDRAAGAPKFG